MSCEDLKEKCARCFDVLKEKWSEWMNRDDILNVQVSTKIVDGVDTGEPSITFYVPKKKPNSKLKKAIRIPKEINGIKTDVVELATDDYELGATSVSKLNPFQQKIMANGVKCKEAPK